LDGYGPFAASNATFVETGRPLVHEAWDHDVAQDVLSGKPPPDDDSKAMNEDADNDQYTPEAIRQREQGKRILAVYTPGHTFGSMSYVFPEIKVCCSGFTLPIEDNREDENPGMDSTGPALDCRGYITTSKAGITRQMESARNLVNNYIDRFDVILPSRGDPLFLDSDNVSERKQSVMEILQQYEKIGKIYEDLGILSSRDDADY